MELGEVVKMTVNQFITNLTLIFLAMIFVRLFIKLLNTHKRSIDVIIDGLSVIGVSGWAIQILGSKTYYASLPALIFLVVIFIQIMRCNGDINKLKGKRYDFSVKQQKPKNP